MARIPDTELERLKREVSLTRLIEAQGLKLISQGKDLACRCPWHEGDDTPSCIVSPKTNLWHCFGCDAGGSVIDWVMRMHKVSFRHACELLAKQHPALAAGATNTAPTASAKLSQGKLRTAQSFSLGDGSDPVARPVVGAYARKLLDNLRAGTPKHLYLPGPHRGVFNRDDLEGQPEIILCEALLDALNFWAAGYRNVTSCYGVNGLTDELLGTLKSCGAQRVLIAFDRDEAGDRGAEVVAKRLTAEGLDCFRLLFPKGMDANAYACTVKPEPPVPEPIGVYAKPLDYARLEKRMVPVEVRTSARYAGFYLFLKTVDLNTLFNLVHEEDSA